jgi:hypothetical protein
LAALALLAGPASPAAGSPADDSEPRVTIAIVPNGTNVERLAGLEGMAPGLLNPGIGSVPPLQTYLDVSQGNRISSSLYEEDLPRLRLEPGRGVEPTTWRRIARRAADAPGEVVPGLLASTLDEAGIPVRGDVGLGTAVVIAADRQGRIVDADAPCPAPGCPGLLVRFAEPRELPRLIEAQRGDDLLIAIERESASFGLSAIGIAGQGFEGRLTSESTRTAGLVATTDLGPTILARVGVEVPDEMNGQPIRAEGEADGEGLATLQERLEIKGSRRGPVIGLSVLIWSALTALVALAFRGRGARIALPLLALSFIYLPLVLLLAGAVHPSLLAERLIAAVGTPVLAAVTLVLLPGYRGLALACAATVGAFGVDLVAGLDLMGRSILGPNLAAGGRFYGINNEIEAVVASLIPIGVGAALAAGPYRDHGRASAVAFAVTGVVGAALFSIGRFGADVGAAIVLPAGAAVAAAVAIGSRRALLLALLAAPLGLAGLVLADLVLGGDSHLTRSLLEAEGGGEVADVIERRLRLTAMSFERTQNLVLLPAAALLIGAGIVRRRQVRDWLAERPALAGFLGAAAATAVGTIANDSGAVLLIFGTAYLAGTAGFAWARSTGSPLAVERSRHDSGTARRVVGRGPLR